jgi:hypothetical protein
LARRNWWGTWCLGSLFPNGTVQGYCREIACFARTSADGDCKKVNGAAGGCCERGGEDNIGELNWFLLVDELLMVALAAWCGDGDSGWGCLSEVGIYLGLWFQVARECYWWVDRLVLYRIMVFLRMMDRRKLTLSFIRICCWMRRICEG